MASSSSTTYIDDPLLQSLMDQLQAATGRDARFLNVLIEAQVRVLDGRFGALFVTEGNRRPRVVAAYPTADRGRISIEPDRMKLLRDCVGRYRKASLQEQYAVREGDQTWAAVCTPLVRQGRTDGVCVVLCPADEEDGAMAPRLSAARLLCRMHPGHVARRMLTRHVRQSAETRKALNVLAAVNDARHFDACAMNACNQVKTELGALRVSLGWGRGNTVRLVAISDTEHLDRRQQFCHGMEAAMEECFDQAQPIVAPADRLTRDDAWLSEAVARCHHELIAAEPGSGVASVVLRQGDDVLGVLTAQFASDAVDRSLNGRSISHLQAIADLISPRLADRRAADRSPAVRIAAALRESIGTAIGPHHLGLKLGAAAVFALLLYVCLATWEYRVHASFTLQAQDKRIYSAYYDTTIDQVDVKKGDSVQQGAVLARLDAREIRIALKKVTAQLVEEQTVHRLAMREKDTPSAQRSRARIRRHEAERERLEFLSSRSTITAREAGVVLEGEWHQRLGERVEKGQALFEVAPIEKLRAVIYVDESQIERVHAGSEGELATRAHPEQVFRFRVDRVIPLGEPLQGKNVFEVYAELEGHSQTMRPGMEGTARINAGRATVIWIATHKLVDFLRLKLWM